MTSVIGEVRPNDGSHPLKSVFKDLCVRQLDVARYCGVSTSSLAHYLNGYRRAPVSVETKMQALAAKVRREREAMAQAVAGDAE